MRLRDVRISRQLALAMGLVFMAIIALSVLSWLNARNLWKNTSDIYNHPLTVRRALGSLQVDILTIHRDMRQMVIEQENEDIEQLVLAIDAHETDALRQLNILDAAYLGPKSDLERVAEALHQWDTIRTETIRILRSGDREQASERVSASGAGGQQVDKIMSLVDVISQFATNKGDEIYQTAYSHLVTTLRLQVMIPALILVLMIGIWLFLLMGITTPLRELTQVTDRIRKGELSIRSQYQAKNEYGQLSDAFNAMADTLEEDIAQKNQVTILSSKMLRETDLTAFCKSVLLQLLDYGNAQIGAVFVLNQDRQHYDCLVSVGSDRLISNSMPADQLRGELELARESGRVIYIDDIPKDERESFAAVSGSQLIRSILTVPIIYNEETIALMSLSSIKRMPHQFIRLVESINSELSARINSLLVAREVDRLSQNLQQSNLELSSQAKELSMQTDELTEQNIELEIQKQKLDEASQLKSQFMSNMSHELRTPLNSVIALTSVLNRRLQGKIPDDEYSYLAVIERNGRHLLDLVNDILDLSRIEAGKEEIIWNRVNVNILIAEMVDMFQTMAKDKGISLVKSAPVDLPYLISDSGKVRHILQNLIANAIKFTDRGEVGITAAYTSDGMEIAISDTGIGIRSEDLDIIFDEFRQVDGSSTRKNGGTGLGLAIARRYAMLLGGHIRVDSQPMVGSTFTLWLPLPTQNPDLTEATLGSSGSGHFSWNDESMRSINQSRHILLVDDSEPAIIQIEDILTEKGYQVHCVHSGKDALESIGDMRIDGVILDLMMPEMDGYAVLEAIRGMDEEHAANLPVLILTAKRITSSDLAFMKKNQVTQLIQKGAIDKTELLAAVHYLTSPDRQRDKRALDTPEPDHPSTIKTVREKPLILIVEDNADNLLTASVLLQDQYELVSAGDGVRGIEMASQVRPDIILMDISLPGINGIEAMNRLKLDPDTSKIPIIALTAHAMAHELDGYQTAGFQTVVAKPIDQATLLEAIRSCLYGS